MNRFRSLRALGALLLLLAAASCGAGGETYVVQPGDTGLEIARQLGVPFSRLAELNPSTDWRRLIPGEELRVPPRNGAAPTAQSWLGDWRDRIFRSGGEGRPPGRAATGVVIVYRGRRLQTIDPQIVASGLPALDHLPLLGHRIRHVEGRFPGDLEAFVGRAPLNLAGRSISRFSIEIPEESARALVSEIRRAPAGKPLPVAFWWRG